MAKKPTKATLARMTAFAHSAYYTAQDLAMIVDPELKWQDSRARKLDRIAKAAKELYFELTNEFPKRRG